jgi:hypothetical protein
VRGTRQQHGAMEGGPTSASEPAAVLSSALRVDATQLALHITSSASATPAAVRKLGCTHAVLISAAAEAFAGAGEWDVESMCIPIADDIRAAIHEHFEPSATFIGGALASGGRVVACCDTGTSAAPAIVAYYLMRYHGLRLLDAVGAIREVQPHAMPNVGFWQRLVEAESWLHVCATPSMSVQQYKWSYIESHESSECKGRAGRAELLQRLELAQAEVTSLLHHHSFTPV